MSIRRRLVIGLSLILLAGLIGIASSVGVSVYSSSLLSRLVERNLPQLESSGQITRLARTLEIDSFEYLAAPSPSLRAEVYRDIAPLTNAIESYRATYQDANTPLVDQLVVDSTRLQAAVRDLLDAVDAEQAAISAFNKDAVTTDLLLNDQLDFIAGPARLPLIDLRLRLQAMRLATYQYITTNAADERLGAITAANDARGVVAFRGQDGFPTELVNSVITLSIQSRMTLDAHDAREAAVRTMRDAMAEHTATTNTLNEQVLRNSEQLSATVQTTAYFSQVGAPLLGLAAFGGGLIIGWWIWRGVAKLLNLMVRSSDEVRRGTYAVVPRNAQGEVGAMMTAFDEMVLALHARDQALNAANAELSVAVKRAEEASRLKSQFLATMSHELRTPMTGILGFVHLLQRGIYGPLSADIQEALHSIDSNGHHLLRLINDVLDIARIESGKVELQISAVNLRGLVDQAIQATRSMAEEKHLPVEATIDPALPSVLLGDELRLRQVAINFLSNAVKFTEHGKVELHLRLVDPATWQIQVKDSGIGIAPENQALVWESFRQVDGSTSRFYNGSGLGLAIVRELVMLMGGTITLESEPGVGSTFTATLPIQQVHSELPVRHTVVTMT